MSRPLIAYYRVSTDKQGRSGLGLDAQRSAVAAYAEGRQTAILAEYHEVESGKRNDRPELAKALAHCRKVNAVLVIAKLDRLARNVRFLLTILEGAGEAGVVFCDLPSVPEGPAGKFVVTMLAGVAELEAGLTSQRTKAALAAAKARGQKLGCPTPRNGAAVSAGVRMNRADDHAVNVAVVIDALRRAGLTSLRQIAEGLNARGIPTARGGQWHPATVKRVLSRAALLAQQQKAA